jgi:integrase
MASLEIRGKSWRVFFNYKGKQHTFTIGEVDAAEASVWKAQTEELLRFLKRNLVSIPNNCTIEQFMFYRGKPPDQPLPTPPETSFAKLRDSYLKMVGNRGIEENTLCTAKIHFSHIAETLGETFSVNGLSLADLQKHVARRSTKDEVAGVTIKKEIDTLRSAWNWGCRMGYVEGPLPCHGLVYPQSEEKLAFMTWAEIESRIAGGAPAELWECLYLTELELADFLDFVQCRKAPEWVYPMCVLAAHTGARRSEMIRAERQDVDLDAGVITLREKNRVRGRPPTRRVPLSNRLKAALAAIPDSGTRLFGKRSVQAVQKAFMRLVGKQSSGAKNLQTKEKKEAKKRTKWSVILGWHVLRHSFIAALANRGIDQRIVDELVGHQTEKQRRRYRHLYPSSAEGAIRTVFG